MNSIRFSLLTYLLLLLAIALGSFAILVHENASQRLTLLSNATHQALSARTARTNQRLEEGFQATKRTVQTNFDANLLLKAQAFSSHLAQQVFRQERYHAARAVAMVGTGIQAPLGFDPFSKVLASNTSDACNGWTTFGVGRMLNQINLQFVEGDILWSRAEQLSDVYLVRSEQGAILLYSKGLADERLELDPAAAKLKLLDPTFDTVELKSGQKVRQVTMLVPITRRLEILSVPTRPFGYNQRPSPTRMRTYLRPLDPKFVEQGNTPRIFVQYARPLTEVDEVLSELQGDLAKTRHALEQEQEETLAQLDHESRLAIASLRTKLLLICGGTFLLTTLGGIWLVGRGLAPLRRVADAVSQVTARNLSLRLSEDEIPQETALIVEKLQETLTSLERTFAREKQALANISHDLRTPITSLLVTTQVCLRKPRSEPQYREALESCTEIGQQLGALVERLLSLARLDAGVDTIKPEPVDVPELAEQCVSLVRPMAEDNDLTLTLKRDGPLIAQADVTKLREVLVNLLDNAIQYNRPGGRVDVAVQRNNGHVEVAVRDTGIGIAPDKRDRLFERFYRVDPSRPSATIHAGLGLAIVKGYVELMGGSVSVDSVEGQGSTFRVQLRAEAGDESALSK